MYSDEAKFQFYVYVSLLKQTSEAKTPESRVILEEQVRSVAANLKQNGFSIKTQIMNPVINPSEIRLSLWIDNEFIAQDRLIFLFSPEALRAARKEHAFALFNRFVPIFKKSLEEGITSGRESSELSEAYHRTLHEIKAVGWEINIDVSFGEEISVEETEDGKIQEAVDIIPITFTFILYPEDRKNDTPCAVEDVTIGLSKEELSILMESSGPPQCEGGLTQAQTVEELLRLGTKNPETTDPEIRE